MNNSQRGMRMGDTYWLKMSESVTKKLNTVKPFARMENGRISMLYMTIRGVNAI